MNRNFRVLAAYVVMGGVSWVVDAATMPAILGRVITVGEQQSVSALELSLFQDDGNGVFDSGDTHAGSTQTDENGNYEFGRLDPDGSYFVTAAGEVSELQTPFLDPMIVDSFDITQSVIANPVSGGRMNSVSGPEHLLLGGHRDLYLEVVGGIAEAKLRVNPFSINSNLQVDLSAGVTGMAVVTWDGTPGTTGMDPDNGLGGMDLTNGGMYNGLMIRLAVDAAGFGQSGEVRLHSGDDVSVAEFQMPVTEAVNPTGFVFVPFADFTGDADAANAGALQLLIDATNPSLDAQIDLVALTGPTTVNFAFLPEPSSALTIFMGILGLMGFRRHGRLFG